MCLGASTSPTTRCSRRETSRISIPNSPGSEVRTSISSRSTAPTHRSNTTQRDGFGQQAVPEGIAPYNPNSLGGGCPFPAGARGYAARSAKRLWGRASGSGPQSFSDHYSQATLFWESMSEPEQQHIVSAFSFELGKCLSEEIQDRMLANLANVNAGLGVGRGRQPGQDGAEG